GRRARVKAIEEPQALLLQCRRADVDVCVLDTVRALGLVRARGGHGARRPPGLKLSSTCRENPHPRGAADATTVQGRAPACPPAHGGRVRVEPVITRSVLRVTPSTAASGRAGWTRVPARRRRRWRRGRTRRCFESWGARTVEPRAPACRAPGG